MPYSSLATRIVVHVRQVKAVQIVGVLAVRVVPEHDAAALEPPLQVRADRGQFSHRWPPDPGSS